MRVCRIPVLYSIRYFTVLLSAYESRSPLTKTEMSLQVSQKANKTGVVLYMYPNILGGVFMWALI